MDFQVLERGTRRAPGLAMPHIRSKPPLVDLSYYNGGDLPGLLKAAHKAGLPPQVPVYVGNYGIDKAASAQIHKLPNGRYAPLFVVRESNLYPRRELTPAEKKKLGPAAHDRFRGPVPTWTTWPSLSPQDRYRWGQELGARMRDQIRHANAAGTRIDTWQLDEVLSEVNSSPAIREVLTGVLDGVHQGRARLGDKPMQGLVHDAAGALQLAGRTPTPGIKAFFKALDGASLRVIGEEYPDFRGDPRKAADAQAWAQLRMARNGGFQGNVAGKYVAGLTPGYRLVPGLGGNVDGHSQAWVNRWRDGYIEERARIGTSGFSEYNFRFGNSDPQVMKDTLAEIARGVRRERGQK